MLLACATLVFAILVLPASGRGSDLEFAYSCLDGKIVVLKNDLPGRFLEEGIALAAPILLPIGFSVPLWSTACSGTCYVVLREDGTVDPRLLVSSDVQSYEIRRHLPLRAVAARGSFPGAPLR
jgi:hypothetical protein